MQIQRLKLITLPFLLMALAGCQSGTFIHCVSPQVTGRVLAADTHAPLAGATVQRLGSQRNSGSSGPAKGGQLLMRTDIVRTGADGRFVLDSKSVLAVFLRPGWSSVSLAFSHFGYKSFQTNYTVANVTSHSAAGVPIVNTGDVLLQPRVKSGAK